MPTASPPGPITLPPGTPDIMTTAEVAKAWNAATETVGLLGAGRQAARVQDPRRPVAFPPRRRRGLAQRRWPAVSDRERYIDGLRVLAAALEAHPEIPLPFNGSDEHSPLLLGFHGDPDQARGEMATAVRALPCAFAKDPDGKWLNLNGRLGGGLHIQLYAARDAVCTRRVVGTEEREVEDEIQPAVTRKVVKRVEVVEWDCGALLPPAKPLATACPSCGTALEASGRCPACTAEPGQHMASCGHPSNEDGECGCAYWPERAPMPLDASGDLDAIPAAEATS